MRVQAQRSVEPAARVGIVAEAPLDHPAVEELEGVERSEPQSQAGVGESFGASPVAGERPGQYVVSVDARPCAIRPTSESEGVPQAQTVVDVEERGLEVGADAVCHEQPLDDADERILPLRGVPLSVAREEVAECRDRLRKRQHFRRTSCEPDRACGVPLRLLDERERLERVHIAGKDRERCAEMSLGPVDATV